MFTSLYSDLYWALQSARSLTNAAEGHGILCGLICVSPEFDEHEWIDHLVGQAEAEDPPIETWETLRRVVDETASSLQDVDARFQPMLPDDDQPISERTIALSEWCDGFLFGAGMGELPDLGQLSDDCREFLEDLRMITRAAAPSDDEGDQEAESAYFELVEYVKVGVLLIQEEVYTVKNRTQRTPVVH